MSLIKPGSLLIYNGSGHNPIVVGPNADLDKAVEDCCYAKFFNSGQDCAGPDSILVHEKIMNQFLTKYIDTVAKLKTGVYTDADTDVGPITRESELQKFLSLLYEADPEDIKTGGKIGK